MKLRRISAAAPNSNEALQLAIEWLSNHQPVRERDSGVVRE